MNRQQMATRIQQLEADLDEWETLYRELNHRVKNNFQMAAHLLRKARKQTQSLSERDMLQKVQHQLQSVGTLHKLLSQDGHAGRIRASEYFEFISAEVVSAYRSPDLSLSLNLSVDETRLSPNRATYCGLILVELLTNAIKHGFENRSSGTVWVKFQQVQSNKILTVRDNGSGLDQNLDQQTEESEGLKLIRSFAENGLEGSLHLEDGDRTTFTVQFPPDP